MLFLIKLPAEDRQIINGSISAKGLNPLAELIESVESANLINPAKRVSSVVRSIVENTTA